MPIPGQVIDFYDDTQKTYLTKMASELEPWGGQEVLQPDELGKLVDDDFALVVMTKNANVVRKFPLHDDMHVKLASMYFDETHDSLSPTEKVCAATHIREACDAHGIEAPQSVAKYAADGFFSNVVIEGTKTPWDAEIRKHASEELTKSASLDINARIEIPDSHYALILDNDGDVIRKYAMPDEGHVKIAAAYFKKYALDLHPRHRHMFAENVLRRADELDVDVDTSTLSKWASETWNHNVDTYLEQRRGMLSPDSDASDMLDKLSSLRNQATPDVFAEALYEFDKKAGLDRKYDKDIPDPWATSMGTEKTSSWNADVDGETITVDDLTSAANSDKLRSHFGETFQSQFKSHAISMFDSLPDADKIVVKQIAKGQI